MRSITCESILRCVVLAGIATAMVACSPTKGEPSKRKPTSSKPTTTLTATLPPTETRRAKPRPEPVAEANAKLDQASKSPEHEEPTLVESQATETDRFEPELEEEGTLVVRRLITASAVERREPVAASATFSPGEKVYAFIDARNESEEEKALVVHFIGPDGQVRGGITLEIPPQVPRWRTWAFTKRAYAPGLWRVEVRDSEGYLLAAVPFELAEGC